METPWLVAALTLAMAVAGVGVGLAVAVLRLDRRPHDGFEAKMDAAMARLEAERAKDVLAVAKYAEDVSGAAESLKRHRHRIDGAEGARAKREQQQQLELEEQRPRGPQNLDEVMALARQRGMIQ